MDHLPLSNNSVKPNLDIPFVCKLPYVRERDNFNDFPGHHLEDLRNHSLAPNPAEALYSVCQTWLFFGTLTEYFQVSIDVAQFKQACPDGSFRLCTDHLKKLKTQWIESQQFRNADQRHVMTIRCSILFTSALHACEAIEAAGYDPTLHLILFSIRVLLCTLIINTKAIAQSGSEIATLSNLLSRLRFQHTISAHNDQEWPLLMDHMLQNGWWWVVLIGMELDCLLTFSSKLSPCSLDIPKILSYDGLLLRLHAPRHDKC
jgi:hypothetical protein